jgi:hypothetical protein
MPPAGWAPTPAAKSYTWLVVTITAVLLGGGLLVWGGQMVRKRTNPNYLVDASDAPRLIERSVGCKRCRVDRIVVMKDSLVVFMADPSSERNQLWDISGIGGYPRDGWELGRGDAAKAFDPREVDWDQMQREAAAWQARTRRENAPSSVNVVRCGDNPGRICFEFR